MESVIVDWSGQCLDFTPQENLCQKLQELAELSHNYFESPQPIRYFNHRQEYLSGYGEFSQFLTQYAREEARNIVFELLKNNFKKQVEEWRETAKQVREFWDAARKILPQNDEN